MILRNRVHKRRLITEYYSLVLRNQKERIVLTVEGVVLRSVDAHSGLGLQAHDFVPERLNFRTEADVNCLVVIYEKLEHTLLPVTLKDFHMKSSSFIEEPIVKLLPKEAVCLVFHIIWLLAVL